MAIPKLLLAPMSGVTNVAFRALCKKYGADITCTEFVSCSAIVRNNKKTFKMLIKDPSEKPCAVQIFGSNKKEIIESAKFLEKDFDIIDFNCGCPANKVTKIGAGSDLLNYPDKIYDIVKSLVEAIKKPVTVKIRILKDLNKTIEIVKLIEKAGASSIIIHGRTKEQAYSGKADWNIIRKLKESVKIPVCGNGDVGLDNIPKNFESLMIGRSAISNPYIFTQIKQKLKTGEYRETNIKQVFKDFMFFAEKYNLSLTQIRFHAMHFTKGMVNCANLRRKILTSNIEEIKKIFLTD
jgi:tRNA-dihydrouridine synthase B